MAEPSNQMLATAYRAFGIDQAGAFATASKFVEGLAIWFEPRYLGCYREDFHPRGQFLPVVSVTRNCADS